MAIPAIVALVYHDRDRLWVTLTIDMVTLRSK